MCMYYNDIHANMIHCLTYARTYTRTRARAHTHTRITYTYIESACAKKYNCCIPYIDVIQCLNANEYKASALHVSVIVYRIHISFTYDNEKKYKKTSSSEID